MKWLPSIKIRKSRLWIPALGFVLTYGFFHNCCVAPHVDCQTIDWDHLIITFCIIIGLGGARDIVLRKYAYLGEVVKKNTSTSIINNKLWIPLIGWCLVGGFANNMVLVPYLENVGTVEWGGLMAALSVLLTVSGIRDYGIYKQDREIAQNDEDETEEGS